MNKEKLDLYRIINNLTRIFIIISIITFAVKGQYYNVWLLAIAFVLTFYDFFVKKIVKIELSTNVKLSILLLMVLSQVLGSAFDWYGKFHWWDTAVHGISGTISFFIGLDLINKINDKLSKNKIHPAIQILFALCFALAIPALWEIFEFGEDKFLKLNVQNTKGLIGQDAIWDSIEDMLSATIGATIGTIYQIIKTKKEIRKQE